MSVSAADWTPHFAARASGMKRSEVRELLKLLDRPDIISFAGGVPDPQMFPGEELKASYEAVLDDPALAGRGMQYGASEGWAPLREQVAAMMNAKGVRCDVENVLITNGAQQALEFCARLFVDPGAGVMIQNPTYLGALQAFSPYRPTYLPLSEAARAGRPVMAYAMADFQNPTGLSLTIEERAEIARLGRDLGAPVVEDDPYGELRFEAEARPSITAIDLDGRHIDTGVTLYCGTVSKTLAPGLRVGWLVSRREVIDGMVMLKQAADLQVGTLNQLAVCELNKRLPEGRMERLRASYRERRDAMEQSLARHMGQQVSWTKPGGGLFLWLTLPEGIDCGELLPRAVERGVAFVPGKAFHWDGSGANTMRLSYSLATPEQIETGVKRLAGVLHEAVEALG